MDNANCALASLMVSPSYIRQGQQALGHHQHLVKALLSSRRLPEHGWSDATIEKLVQDLALMDSNNFLGQIGMGEREGRVACPLVAWRHYGMAHGIGRSGDVSAEQPKAAGSSLLVKLANSLAADAMVQAGLVEVGDVIILPLATGMAMTVTLSALASLRPPGARYVIWSRIDQKTCFKCILAANMEPVVVDLIRDGDQMVTDVQGIERAVQQVGPEHVVCVMTTTSCFAPRAADDVITVGRLCNRLNVPHMINNAYGVQSRQLCEQVTGAMRKGRVDVVVQSTDKNFMVPVGGAVVAGPAKRKKDGQGQLDVVQAVNKLYPGRAAVNAHLDVLMTLLHWGSSGWRRVLTTREEVFDYLVQRLDAFALSQGEKILKCSGNPISLAMTLWTLGEGAGAPPVGGSVMQEPWENRSPLEGDPLDGTSGQSCDVPQDCVNQGETDGGETAASKKSCPGASFLGAMMWARGISGTRVVAPGKTLTLGAHSFRNYGGHTDDLCGAYLTAAAALGTSKDDVDAFITKAAKCMKEFRKSRQGKSDACSAEEVV